MTLIAKLNSFTAIRIILWVFEDRTPLTDDNRWQRLLLFVVRVVHMRCEHMNTRAKKRVMIYFGVKLLKKKKDSCREQRRCVGRLKLSG